eukprot:TRINITY_DN2583_c0_g1_i2.p1 TRINITY_DN2583_c0_g1~~TRINITY_DN2583_c0_g1_i2.p1  ORF type:complete len:267 (-),score=41.49 TRINITY_DN2583_c0_g1_i2:200-1000(-)
MPPNFKLDGEPKRALKEENKVTLEESLTQRKKNAVILAGGYTRTKRTMEILSVSTFVFFFGVSVYRLSSSYAIKNFWVFICSSILAMGLADFFSGVAHWIADTWGKIDTPVIGNFIRSFREHHLEPVAITHHDFIETNGDSCLVVLPFLIANAFAPMQSNSIRDLFLVSFVLLLCFWIMLTNQIHKWSHTYKPSRHISILQDTGIILSKRDHNKHHQIPFDRNYCITTGWLNPWLTSLGFWRRMEDAITYLTGAVPREDDKYWTKY